MGRIFLTWVMGTFLWVGALAVAHAQEPPKVLVDTAPLHSLVAQVMGDVGQPDLLVPADALPHDFALRPSQARDLEAAQIVFWVGPELTPWLEDALATLSPDARRVEMLRVQGTIQRRLRPGGRAETPMLQMAEDAELDPHAWLDPQNAQAWLMAIAQELALRDPGNAGAYRANALAAVEGVGALEAQMAATLAPVRDRPFIVYHDAFQHFEARFGMTLLGSVAAGEAASPGVRRMVEMRDLAAEKSARCLFTEPQVNGARLRQVFEGSGIRAAVLDPLGADLDPGATLYSGVIENIANTMASCLGG